MKPWDPPTEHLYPQLDDLLEDWQASHHPAYSGIRVLGTRWSPRSYELRDFLARNHVPYQWIDAEISASDPETKLLLESLGPEAASLPVVLFPDGTKLLEYHPGASGAESRPADARANKFLRSGDHRRRAGRSRCRRVRSIGRFAHGNGRAGSAGRPGGHELAHRKLSWLSGGAQRRRSGPPRGGAGAAIRRGNPGGGSGRKFEQKVLTGSSSSPTEASFPATR